MTRILFHSNALSVRGTEVAVFDYALHNRDLLGNDSLIVYDARSPGNDEGVVEKFRREFPVLGYTAFEEVDALIMREAVDLFYAQKAGAKDGVISSVVPTIVHAVFPAGPSSYHGSCFAFISSWLSNACNPEVPFVPYIVQLPPVDADLRDELGIPRDDVMVFGCHGGANSFDIKFVRRSVRASLDRRSDLYFVFLNIAPFTSHERVHFLRGTPDLDYKVKFINTCDAMLHARALGESFGLACGEFSIRNRPVLTYSHSPHRNHIEVLGSRAFLYGGPRSLTQLLLEVRPSDLTGRDWDCYSEPFSAERVMRLFNEVLIEPALDRGPAPSPRIRGGRKSQLKVALLTARTRVTGPLLARVR